MSSSLHSHVLSAACRHYIHLTTTFFKETTVLWSEKRAVRIQWISDMADIQRTKKSTMGVCGREFRGEKFKENVLCGVNG